MYCESLQQKSEVFSFLPKLVYQMRCDQTLVSEMEVELVRRYAK
jgi:hypothetical protein